MSSEASNMSLSLVVRGSQGLCLQAPPDFAIHQGFAPDPSKNVKAFSWNKAGTGLAWSNMNTVTVAVRDAKTDKWVVRHQLPQPKVACLSWSPGGTLLATWEQYAVIQGQQPQPNLHLWNTETGEKVKSFFQKKMSGWCPQWSSDEKICSRIVNNEVQFYEDNSFLAIKNKIHMSKVANYSMSHGSSKSLHVVTYVPGAKGAPCFTKMYQYPNFDDNQVIANKSFFQADSVEYKWNNQGNTVLLLTQNDVDKTGGSYYGKQQLHYMSVKGESGMVGLAKEGPIYSVEWSPNGSLFVAVYGFMPAKATMYGINAEPVFDFGTGPRNTVMFNPQSSLAMLGGFGNLRGRIQMWDVKAKVLVSEFEAPDSTDVRWCPDGQRLLTSTCAPRLRMGNGYKVWHYSGSLLHEKPFQASDELWEVDWQTAPPGAYGPFKISKAKVMGIEPSQPIAAKQAYRPPGARGTQSTFKLHDDDEAPQNKQGAKPADSNESLSKSQLKNKKRREAAKMKAKEDQGKENSGTQGQAFVENNSYVGAKGILSDPEIEKKIRKLKDKIASIEKIKQAQAEGKQLEKNQIEKLSKEQDLLNELKALTLS